MDNQTQQTFDIGDHVLIALRRIIRAIDTQSRVLVERRGVTVPQLVVLQNLTGKRQLSIGELARQIHLGQATVSGIVDRLEQRQFVKRTRGDADRRQVYVEVTEAGRQMVADAPSPLQERLVQRLAELKPWEQTQILASLQHLVAMMEAEHVDATPILTTGPISANAAETQQFLTPGEQSAELPLKKKQT